MMALKDSEMEGWNTALYTPNESWKPAVEVALNGHYKYIRKSKYALGG